MSNECIESKLWVSDLKIKISHTKFSMELYLSTFGESVNVWVLSWERKRHKQIASNEIEWLIDLTTHYLSRWENPKRSQPHNVPISIHKKTNMDPSDGKAAISIEFDVKRSKTNCYSLFASTKQRFRFLLLLLIGYGGNILNASEYKQITWIIKCASLSMKRVRYSKQNHGKMVAPKRRKKYMIWNGSR